MLSRPTIEKIVTYSNKFAVLTEVTERMYLLLNDNEKIIINTTQELGNFQLDKYKVYTLVPMDASELINDGEIRDAICSVLKGEQMTKRELIEQIYHYIDIPESKISKVITKMKKEKVIYNVDDWNYMGERFIGMD